MTKLMTDVDIPYSQVDRAIALGFFDGVHLGHQALMAALRELARKNDLLPSVYTFQKAPGSLFQENFLGLLETASDRYQSLSELGAAEIIAQPLLPEILECDPDYFMEEILYKRLRAKALVVGRDYTFGYQAAGTVADLRAFADSHGIALEVVGDYIWQEQVLSSSLIRQMISKGKLREANSLMHHDFHHLGKVSKGKQLGRRLDFPTINLKTDPQLVSLAYGVYLSKVRFIQNGQPVELPAISSVGVRPTVTDNGIELSESYILADSFPLYGDEVCVTFMDFMRPEYKFPSILAMQEQVLSDIAEARERHKREQVLKLSHRAGGQQADSVSII